MTQNNQNNLVQFYRELGEQVDVILLDSKKLLSALAKFLSLYPPNCQEEDFKFCGIKFILPDSVGMLCDLKNIIIPNGDDMYDSVAPLRDTALDVATRMVGADVIINDIINMHIEPHDSEIYIRLYLTMLESVSHSIHYMGKKLEELYQETSQIWANQS